jgi:uncharacterized protein
MRRARQGAKGLLPLLVINFLLPTPAPAASFDCSAAATADEKAICSNAGLSAFDSEMAGLWFGYKAMPLPMGASGNRKDVAQAFLKARATCGSDTGCLTELYDLRIATLKHNIRWAMKNYCGN